MELAWHTFSPLLQYKLDQVKLQWNTHILEEQDMILSLEGQTVVLLPELSGGQNQRTNISDSEIDSAYSKGENLMEDATVIMNDVDEELVDYFENAAREENLLNPPTNWKEVRKLFLHNLER